MKSMTTDPPPLMVSLLPVVSVRFVFCRWAASRGVTTKVYSFTGRGVQTERTDELQLGFGEIKLVDSIRKL